MAGTCVSIRNSLLDCLQAQWNSPSLFAYEATKLAWLLTRYGLGSWQGEFGDGIFSAKEFSTLLQQ